MDRKEIFADIRAYKKEHKKWPYSISGAKWERVNNAIKKGDIRGLEHIENLKELIREISETRRRVIYMKDVCKAVRHEIKMSLEAGKTTLELDDKNKKFAGYKIKQIDKAIRHGTAIWGHKNLLGLKSNQHYAHFSNFKEFLVAAGLIRELSDGGHRILIPSTIKFNAHVKTITKAAVEKIRSDDADKPKRVSRSYAPKFRAAVIPPAEDVAVKPVEYIVVKVYAPGVTGVVETGVPAGTDIEKYLQDNGMVRAEDPPAPALPA